MDEKQESGLLPGVHLRITKKITPMDDKQERILNVFRYVPADDSSYWAPALREATPETLQFALNHATEKPTLGKVKIKKIQARLRKLQTQKQTAAN